MNKIYVIGTGDGRVWKTADNPNRVSATRWLLRATDYINNRSGYLIDIDAVIWWREEEEDPEA